MQLAGIPEQGLVLQGDPGAASGMPRRMIAGGLDPDRDRDGGGEFLQLYTRSVGGVFLEVVERRGGYDGYGAPNAPIRLAAQLA